MALSRDERNREGPERDMTYSELIAMCRQEFVLLHKLANSPSIKRDGKRAGIRECVREEAIAAIAFIDEAVKGSSLT